MTTAETEFLSRTIKRDEIDNYLIGGKDFIDDALIERQIAAGAKPQKSRVREIISKAMSIERLDPEETAALLNVEDEELWEEMARAAGDIKRKVYDNRIVTFAPLYCSNHCVNNCLYCGFRTDNTRERRRKLTLGEVRKEAESLCKIGHKRLIMVYGEHPSSSADYIADTIKAVYDVKVPARNGFAQIRRANINAAPMSVEDLKKLWKAGIGTYQVFQETYHHKRYSELHPSGIKADYKWRLYALHRALDAGIDDVAIGALFGLYDWRFEVMGMVYHAIDLENRFGIGPHTISFPRLNPAEGTDICDNSPYMVSDDDFRKLVIVLRLSIPYSGMIITARESAEMRRKIIPLGCTQTDASTRIGIGAYSEAAEDQESDRQQFMLGDTRSLDEVVREFTRMGLITSFCTAGYRCGRTGDKIMKLLKSGVEGKFCKLNAVLTYKEWIDDFASKETRAAAEEIIQKEIEQIKNDPFYRNKKLLSTFDDYLGRITNGERDLYI
jgi:2-iminoacetate synthase